jgi:hypothetical protein
MDGLLAEGVGFEPTIRFPVYTLSKRAPSATRPSLRGSRGRNIVEVGGRTTRAGGLISGSSAGHRGAVGEASCCAAAMPSGPPRRRRRGTGPLPGGGAPTFRLRGKLGRRAAPGFRHVGDSIGAAWRGEIGSTPAARARAKTGTPGRGAGTTPTSQRDRPWTFPLPAPRFPVSASRSRCWRPGCWSPSRSGAIR